jgi:hypothetical protein
MKGLSVGVAIFGAAFALAVGSMYLTSKGAGTYAGTGPEVLVANVLTSFESLMSNLLPDLFTNGE